jgi:hypothetical protein
MNNLRNIRAQQEIVGFVLIVVLVVIGLMIFLMISFRDSPETTNDVKVDNLLTSLMKYTTSCAIVFEPNYETLEDLFKSCHKGKKCKNLNIDACEYLNQSLVNVSLSLLKTEASISSYQIDLLEKDSDGETLIMRVGQGNCTSRSFSAAQKSLVSGSESLVVRMRLCSS